MERDVFKIIFFVGFVAAVIVRLFYRLRTLGKRVVVSRITALEIFLLVLAVVGMVIVPILYVFTARLDFADYRLPAWTSWAGTAVFIVALWLLWLSHAALGRNWSSTLEIGENHRLVTEGIYRRIRHPMYAAIWLWGVAQVLLLHNWIAGWSHLSAFGLLYFLRVPREERMMLDRFGEEYRAYMNRTGRVFPRLF
jgi:protein-S-isoprenylcysteine O-methyltransferase Ste14